MVRKNLLQMLALVTGLGFARFGITSAEAMLLYDRSIAPNGVNDIGYSDVAYGQRMAESFSFADPVIVNQVAFLGGYFPANTPLIDSFTLTLYNNNAARGLPDSSSVVAQIYLGDFGRSGTGISMFGMQFYQYTVDFNGVAFSAGDTYWLTIVNDTTSDANDDWVWAGNTHIGNWARSSDGGASWIDTPNGSFSFALGGVVVPEPATLTLSALGCLLLCLRRPVR